MWALDHSVEHLSIVDDLILHLASGTKGISNVHDEAEGVAMNVIVAYHGMLAY